MEPLPSLPHPQNSADLALAQAEFCILNMGQALMDAEVAGLEQHAHALLTSLVVARAALAAPDPAGSGQGTKAALQKCLVTMSLQLQQQRQLLVRKASMVDRQLGTLPPQTSRLTYEPAKDRSFERRGTSTYFKA